MDKESWMFSMSVLPLRIAVIPPLIVVVAAVILFAKLFGVAFRLDEYDAWEREQNLFWQEARRRFAAEGRELPQMMDWSQETIPKPVRKRPIWKGAYKGER